MSSLKECSDENQPTRGKRPKNDDGLSDLPRVRLHAVRPHMPRGEDLGERGPDRQGMDSMSGHATCLHRPTTRPGVVTQAHLAIRPYPNQVAAIAATGRGITTPGY